MEAIFTQRKVGAWNTLQGMVVEADLIAVFKRPLDRHVDMQKMEGYRSRAGSGDLFNLPLCSGWRL